MANRDIKNNIRQDIIFNDSINSDTLTNCTTIDMQGYNAGVMFSLCAANYFDGSYSIAIEDSADGVTFAAIALDKVLGNYGTLVTTANSLGRLATVGCFSTNRYIRVVITSTAVTTGSSLIVVASRKGDKLPV